MKLYTLSFADSLSHVPEHPERTAVRQGDFTVTYREWPNALAMHKTIAMQSKCAAHRSDWQAWKPRDVHFHISRRTESGNAVTDCQRFDSRDDAERRIRSLAWAKYEQPLPVQASKLCCICRHGLHN